MKGKWNGAPGEWIEDATAIDGLRFIASRNGWTTIRKMLSDAAKDRCENCNGAARWGEAHHVYGRGFGGGKREDRISVEGVRFLVWLCRVCHSGIAIRRWGSWRESASTTENVSRGICV